MPINIDHYEDLAGNVLALYEEAERTMMRRVARRLNRGITQPGWTERKYGEMRDVSREMSRYVDTLSKTRGEMQRQYLEQAYTDARNAMISDARTFADLAQIQGLTPNTIKVVNILSELESSMSAADRLILRSVNDAYADIVGHASALVATGSITYREAVKRELDDFANRGITSFVDRGGRSWDMETYAEMATLTAIERATREGYTDTMQEFGYDLAEISDHYGACPICEAWQGVIISISGNTPGYQSLADAEAAGVFHPCCMHDYSVYYEGISPQGRMAPGPVGDPNAGYAVRSQQRYFERMERQWKRRMAVAQTPEKERAAYARVRIYQQRIRDLIADYNYVTDPKVDRLPRKYWREGGTQNLSAAAKRLKPVQIPLGQQPQPFVPQSTLNETRGFQRNSSGGAWNVINGHGIADQGQSYRDIMAMFRTFDRTNSVWSLGEVDENGNVIDLGMNKSGFELLKSTAEKLMSRMVEKNNDVIKDYADINAFLRKNSFYLSKYDRANIPDFRDYARQNHFVRLTLDASKRGLDSAYQELLESHPYLFSEKARNAADELIQINNVMEFLKGNRFIPIKEIYDQEGLQEIRKELMSDLLTKYVEARDKAIRREYGRK